MPKEMLDALAAMWEFDQCYEAAREAESSNEVSHELLSLALQGQGD